jgi:peptidoglycan/xylan/chitin deacetylase (PgdA/CDA1 family)
MITFCFDDGYQSVYQYAYFILEKYGFVGPVFAISSIIGEAGHMDWDQLKELYQNGWE